MSYENFRELIKHRIGKPKKYGVDLDMLLIDLDMLLMTRSKVLARVSAKYKGLD
jgi:hypothetical protein